MASAERRVRSAVSASSMHSMDGVASLTPWLMVAKDAVEKEGD